LNDKHSPQRVKRLIQSIIIVGVMICAAVIAVLPLSVPPAGSSVITGGFSVGRAMDVDIILLMENGTETTRAGSLSFVEQHPQHLHSSQWGFGVNISTGAIY
jgi:hypothetical protein